MLCQPPRRPHPTRRPGHCSTVAGHLRHTWARTGCAPARPPTLTPRLPSVHCAVTCRLAVSVLQMHECECVCVRVCVQCQTALQTLAKTELHAAQESGAGSVRRGQPHSPGATVRQALRHPAVRKAGVAERAFSQSAYLFLFMAQRAVSAGTATSQPTARASLTLEHSTLSMSRS